MSGRRVRDRTFRYREVGPPGALADRIRCFWFLETDGRAVQPVVPDGRLELVVHLGEPFGRGDQVDARVLIAGQLTRPLRLGPRGPVRAIGVRFRTAAARDFLQVTIDGLTDRVVPAAEVCPRLADSVADAARRRDPVEALSRVLIDQVHDARHAATAGLVAELSRGRPVHTAARDSGLSLRSAERHLRADTGLTPKLLQRIIRFRRYYRAVAEHPGDAGRIALSAGYYDQAHAGRDFLAFTGSSRTRHFSGPHDLAEAFLSHSS